MQSARLDSRQPLVGVSQYKLVSGPSPTELNVAGRFHVPSGGLKYRAKQRSSTSTAAHRSAEHEHVKQAKTKVLTNILKTPSYTSKLRNWVRRIYWSTPIPHRRHAVPEISIAASLLHPGSVAVDVGADVGLFTVAMARAVGSSGIVLAVEPHPESFTVLTHGLRARGFSWVRALPVALGSKNGSTNLCTPLDPSGSEHAPFSRVQDTCLDDQSVRNRPVGLMTLDDLVSEHQLQRLDLIKIDVEGFEQEVLLGARNSLKRFSPILMIELEDRHTRHYGRRTSETLELLASWGFLRWIPAGAPSIGVNYWFRKDD